MRSLEHTPGESGLLHEDRSNLWPKERIKMYDIPGHAPLTEKDIERYEKTKEKLMEKLPDLIQKKMSRGSWSARRFAAGLIELAPKNKQDRLRASLIPLIQEGLGDEDWQNRQNAVLIIGNAPEEERTILIQKGLGDVEWQVRQSAARMIEYAPEKKQRGLRAALIPLIQKDLGDEDWLLRQSATRMIAYAPEEERTDLIQKGLRDKSEGVRQNATDMIAYAPEEERTDLIQKGLRDKEGPIRLAAVRLIGHAPERERVALLKKGLGDESWFIRSEVAEMIGLAPKDEQYRLRASLIPLIQKGLDSESVFVCKNAAWMIEYAPEEERTALIKKGLGNENEGIRQIVARMVAYAPEEAQAKLLAQIKSGVTLNVAHGVIDKNKNLQQLAETTPLYKKAPQRFFRASFEKSGSRTTLLDTVPGQPDNTLKEKVIIRHIPFLAYATWTRAFEASDFWKDTGFDYVPVEPIIGTQPDPKNATDVAVFTGVLGPSVEIWKKSTTLFHDHIDTEIRRIKSALKTLGIEHGHTHEGNFCLVFDKTKDGKADLTKPPRVYVIDFDMAVSSGPTK